MKLPIKYSESSFSEKREARNEYITKQNNLCYFCGKPLDEPAPKVVTDKKINWSIFPKNFLKYPIHLQHDHETDKTEGAVHNYCNAVMWQYYNK